MGIGRREFLKFAATALGGLVVDPARVVAVNGDYYVNARLGLGFVKPIGWAFDAFQDFAAKHDGQILQGLPPEADEGEFLRDQASSLVATISKYGDELRQFSPSITVYKNQGDYEESLSGGLERLALHAIDGFAALLRDYEVIEEPRRREVSHCPAIRFKCRWVFEHREIEPILIEDEALAIDDGSRLYTIHLYDSPATGDVARGEFARFLKSLHIA